VVISGQFGLYEPPSQIDELFDAICDLELEAAVFAAESGKAAQWWAQIGGWLSAVVFALSGATGLLAFVALHDSGDVASTTLGTTALFLTLALAATLKLKPGATSTAELARQEITRRYIEALRRFRRTEARAIKLADAWERFDAFAQMLIAIKGGRLDISEIQRPDRS